MEVKKELKDFLVYSYFGIVPECIYDDREYEKNNDNDEFNDYCMKMVIIKAYSDATNQGAYNTLFDKNLSNIDKLKKSSEEAKKQSAKFLLEELKKLKNQHDFDAWHEELCNNIVNKYCEVKDNEKAFFTYGNAQKWVNMTIKYLWVLGMLPNSIKEKDLHIPVDSFIIDALYKGKEKDDNIDFPKIEGKKLKEGKYYEQPSSYFKPWSKWEKDEYYETFHDSIKGKKYNLSWENIKWIESAERRKRKEREDRYTGFFGE